MASCKKCLWYGRCYTAGECDDFTPVEIDVESLIEDERFSFYEEWKQYIKENE